MTQVLRYVPDAEQRELAGSLRDTIEGLLPLNRLHDASEESPETWTQLEDAGVFGIALPEAAGGSGLGPVEEALISIDLGRQLASPSVLAALYAAHLEGFEPTDGRIALAYPSASGWVAVNADGASQLLVRTANQAWVQDVPQDRHGIENRLWLGSLERVELSPPLAEDQAEVLQALRLIDAAVLSGMAMSATDMAVAYAKLREQFGRPIGSFQAIKHHCANMAMAASLARDQVSFAAVALADARDDAALQVECALSVAMSAAIDNAGLNIQIHGGIGFSDEADPHLLLKRAQLQLAIAGGVDAVHRRIADIPPEH